jgi:hypothetical protein
MERMKMSGSPLDHDHAIMLANIAFFFTPPEEFAAKIGTHSVLHLLRREIQECLVGETPQDEEVLLDRLLAADPPTPMHRVFASTMLMLGGIDLLAKFYCGSDKDREVKNRFTCFVNHYIQSAHDGAADALYVVRNTLMHSFGLYDKKTKMYIHLHDERPQVLIPAPAAIQPLGNTWEVSILLLYRDFIGAIKDYHREVRTDPALQDNFGRIYPDYGTLGVS